MWSSDAVAYGAGAARHRADAMARQAVTPGRPSTGAAGRVGGHR